MFGFKVYFKMFAKIPELNMSVYRDLHGGSRPRRDAGNPQQSGTAGSELREERVCVRRASGGGVPECGCLAAARRSVLPFSSIWPRSTPYVSTPFGESDVQCLNLGIVLHCGNGRHVGNVPGCKDVGRLLTQCRRRTSAHPVVRQGQSARLRRIRGRRPGRRHPDSGAVAGKAPRAAQEVARPVEVRLVKYEAGARNLLRSGAAFVALSASASLNLPLISPQPYTLEIRSKLFEDQTLVQVPIARILRHASPAAPKG